MTDDQFRKAVAAAARDHFDAVYQETIREQRRRLRELLATLRPSAT